MWPIERSVVPPILRTRSAISSVVAKISVGLFVEHQVVVAEVGAADVPVEVLGLEIEREAVGQQAVQRRRDGLHRGVVEIGGRIECRGFGAV